MKYEELKELDATLNRRDDSVVRMRRTKAVRVKSAKQPKPVREVRKNGNVRAGGILGLVFQCCILSVALMGIGLLQRMDSPRVQSAMQAINVVIHSEYTGTTDHLTPVWSGFQSQKVRIRFTEPQCRIEINGANVKVSSLSTCVKALSGGKVLEVSEQEGVHTAKILYDGKYEITYFLQKPVLVKTDDVLAQDAVIGYLEPFEPIVMNIAIEGVACGNLKLVSDNLLECAA